jgi:hypothetical protein
VDTLGGSWPGWAPRQDMPALSTAYMKSQDP